MSDAVKCPVCRSDLEIVRRPLMLRQTRILEAIEALTRDLGKLPTAPDIAALVNRPLATVKVDLHVMELARYLHRPDGPKSGWDIQTSQDITLVVKRRSAVA